MPLPNSIIPFDSPNPTIAASSSLSNLTNSVNSGVLCNYASNPSSTVAGISVNGGAPTLTPVVGSINVAKNFPWTLTTGAARNEVPTVTLIEYKLTESALIAAASQWFKAIQGLASSNTTNPYFGLYPATPTGFQYIFPYFSTYNKSINNQWSEANLELSIGKLSVELVENVAKFFTVRTGHEEVKTYTGGAVEVIDINFVLLNTTSIQDVKRNWELCYLLIKIYKIGEMLLF